MRGVALVEPLGAETVCHLRVGELRVAARIDDPWVPGPGERLALRAGLDSLHLFDASTGKRRE